MTKTENNSFNIGLDVISISKFNNCSQSFIKRILTDNEYLEFLKINDEAKPKFLASRWVLKESTFKATKTNKVFFTNIEFIKSPDGYGYICNTFPNVRTSISYNDDLVYCVAICI